jgi:hypothetical protein
VTCLAGDPSWRGDCDERAEGEASQNPGCLRCHQLDEFVQVKAVMRGGRSTGEVRGRVPGRFGYDVPVTATVVQTSTLARNLEAPAVPLIWNQAHLYYSCGSFSAG